jgi:tryptophanyl-tRNA synthetase
VVKETILTGIRVNGELTLGNYLGALLPMVRLTNKYSAYAKANVFVPDLHAIITDIDGSLKANLLKSIKYYLAAGLVITPNVSIYRQSYIPAHSELTWILNCFANMGEVSRMIQYKEKGDGKDSANVGIFDYPILMAADILLYDAVYVPVGKDQFQHLELTRNLAERFNHRIGRDVFTLPVATAEQAKFMGVKDGICIRDLQNPEKKMSKSTAAENSKIMLSDAPEAAAKKIMSATTDNVSKVQFDMFNQPGISNLLQILAFIRNQPLSEVAAGWAGVTQYGEFKTAVAEEVKGFLIDFQARVAEISDEEVLSALENGEKKASKVAETKLYEVQRAVGLR